MAVQASGDYRIDALINTSSGSWWDELCDAGTNTISYTFVSTGSAYNGVTGMHMLDSAQQSAVTQAMAYVASVTGIHFQQSVGNPGTEVLRFCSATSMNSNVAAYCASYGAGNQFDLVFSEASTGELTPGSYGYQALLHEIGHALGLKHPFEDEVILPSSEDKASNTLMSYTDDVTNATTYSPYDLYALNWIYGGDGIGGTYGLYSTLGPLLPGQTAPAAVEHQITAQTSSVTEGDSATQTLAFTITRSGAGVATATSTVSWTTTGTVDAADFGGFLPSGQVSFAAGESSKTIYLALHGDTSPEEDETLTVQLSSPTGHGAALGVNASASVAILNDDPQISLIVAANSSSVLEGDAGVTPVFFTVTRSGKISIASTASWSVGGTVDGGDFGGVLPSGTVSFAAGETTKTIAVNIKGDTLAEFSENLVLTLVPGEGSSGGGTATTRILNDDISNILSVAALADSVLEGNNGTTVLQYVVSRTGDRSAAASVQWDTSSSEANGTDFLAGILPYGTLSFAAGESTKTLSLQVKGDKTPEGNETVFLHLHDATGLGTAIGTDLATTTLLNDDEYGVVTISALDASQPEGSTGKVGFHFALDRTGGDISSAAHIAWAVNGGTANAVDFGGKLPSGTASFSAGQTHTTVTVYVTGDSTTEVDESFTVKLGTGDIVKASDISGSATATILSDDGPVVFSITPEVASKPEGSSNALTTPFNFIVERAGNPSVAASVNWQLVYPADGASTNDFDGNLPLTGVVSFAAGETSKLVSIQVKGDYSVEADENFSVKLTSAMGGTVSTTKNVATATILDDDAPSSFSITPGITITEGNTGTSKMVFTVERLTNPASYSTVKWTLENLTTDASDFSGPTSGSLTFLLGGADKQMITINVKGDNAVEMHEKFDVQISGGSTTSAISHALILNDDVTPRTIAPAFNSDPAFLFDASYYAAKVHDLIPSSTLTIENALQDFLSQGLGSNWISPTAAFDASYYESRWADLGAQDLDRATLFAHWNKFGIWEGRAASQAFEHFDGSRYLADNPDVATYVDANISGFLGSRTNGAIAHFVIFGASEQRVAYDTEGALIEMGYTL